MPRSSRTPRASNPRRGRFTRAVPYPVPGARVPTHQYPHHSMSPHRGSSPILLEHQLGHQAGPSYSLPIPPPQVNPPDLVRPAPSLPPISRPNHIFVFSSASSQQSSGVPQRPARPHHLYTFSAAQQTLVPLTPGTDMSMNDTSMSTPSDAGTSFSDTDSHADCPGCGRTPSTSGNADSRPVSTAPLSTLLSPSEAEPGHGSRGRETPRYPSFTSSATFPLLSPPLSMDDLYCYLSDTECAERGSGSNDTPTNAQFIVPTSPRTSSTINSASSTTSTDIHPCSFTSPRFDPAVRRHLEQVVIEWNPAPRTTRRNSRGCSPFTCRADGNDGADEGEMKSGDGNGKGIGDGTADGMDVG
ncbi:MAG: hypothetical protein M1833_003593 [Piccolia ochrophora]|nr:MAG: hypothetical protein M1833_003593 [Piccolia ochrophora]